ncbi:carboxypeptidase-like regulatory domain-containing protein [Mucilaginibacter ginkgonis]|uniref:Carboxypeptidase regulatory-like domain-containing protein n=1 Tax=Mucilaginibacter ginkgonis TaxID=2682091 RepID=A0A6I4HWL8_9SPHI|nr:carboxypeptidase-like regulatory domain-containing protein [Mucilaginibacter ginkgonis]QQL50015.1 carboxypeptidase regulatory-like domain-containing protein [Mucilaginibacter ginkgonis]
MKKYFYLLFFCLFTATVYAQSDSVSLTSLVESAVKVNNSHPVEKVYLHFDKPYYAVGDTIWFKAYLTMEAHQLSELSKVVNVDVISDRDSLIETVKLPVTGGTAAGSVVLNGLTYRQGNYHFKAYTLWQLNFPPSYLFDKVVTIGGSANKGILASASYSGNIADKNSKLNARILYKNPDGTLLANRRVDWRLDRNGDQITKGKGVTDGAGYLTIELAGTKAEDITAGTLITGLETADKQIKTSAFTLKNAFNGTDVQFFPEGGTLVADIPNIVAFKALQTNGLGLDVKGTIVDDKNQQVGTFSSQHLGMGKFTFAPAVNAIYKAKIEFPDGTKGTYQLPRVTNSGITLAVNNSNATSLILQLNASQTYFEKHKNQAYYIIAKTGGYVMFAAQAFLNSQTYSATIPKSKFKTGVLQLTLLSTAGDPLSERLVYIDHNDPLNISLSTDKPSYLTRQKVLMKAATKFGDKPAEANMSVSVVDESKVAYNDNQATTIASYLLLTSDISGYVEQPNYYFGTPSAKKADDLDVLMLTQGFRQFTFFDIVDNKIPPIRMLAEQGINLTGTLRKFNGMPVFKGNVRLIIPDKGISAETITDADGNFIFRNVVFTDSSSVTINARNNVDAHNLKLTMNADFYPAVTKQQNFADEMPNIDSVLNVYVKNSERQYQTNRVLKEVVIKASTKKKIDHTTYPALSGLSNMPDHVLDGEQLKGCNNLLACLPSMLMGIMYRDNNFYFARDYNLGNTKPIQFYARGLQVDVSYLSTLDPKSIESIESFSSDGFTGINKMTDTHGVVVINLKEQPKGTKISLDELKRMLPEPNVVSFTPKGYVKTRQFYSPKYEVTRAVQNSDLRSTIFWNPNVLSDKLGNAAFSFYTSDGRGTYKAVIEGIDKDGNLGRTVYKFTVK